MAVVAATTNGGRINKVHRQTDDGIVFSVAVGDDLLPITFRYTDYLGDPHETLISSGRYHHARLMRGDCMECRDDSAITTFSWAEIKTPVVGFVEAPEGTFEPVHDTVPNCAENVALKGLRMRHRACFRRDRDYWDPGMVLQATVEEDPFAFLEREEENDCCLRKDVPYKQNIYKVTTIEQWNPISCPPNGKPNKCGILEYKGGKH